MNEHNQKNSKSTEESLKNEQRGMTVAKSGSGFKKLLAKKWFSPALFMITAAIIVSLLWVYQDMNTDKPTTGTEVTEIDEAIGSDVEEAVALDEMNEDVPSDLVVATGEDMVWPVANFSDLQVEIPFYDSRASATEREAALIQVGTTFAPHMGVDFTDPEGKAFDVMAALSGEVTLVENNPINGHIVEISHGNGLVTVYQSLAEVTVQEGDEIDQGTIIAKAGRSDIERDLGIHLHFETRVNGGNVNPSDFITQ